MEKADGLTGTTSVVGAPQGSFDLARKRTIEPRPRSCVLSFCLPCTIISSVTLYSSHQRSGTEDSDSSSSTAREARIRSSQGILSALLVLTTRTPRIGLFICLGADCLTRGGRTVVFGRLKANPGVWIQFPGLRVNPCKKPGRLFAVFRPTPKRGSTGHGRGILLLQLRCRMRTCVQQGWMLIFTASYSAQYSSMA